MHDYNSFANDLFSYQKEVEFDGEWHNIVLVVEHFLDVDRLRARDIVAQLMTARMRQFEHVVSDDLPALFNEFDLSQEAREALIRYTDDLKQYMAGNLEFHRSSLRYREAGFRRDHRSSDFSFLPTGLGTSALKVLTRPSASIQRIRQRP